MQKRILVVSFSVLIIAQGREELLLKCLDSLHPSIENWQLILVANGMTLSESVISKSKTLTPEVDILDLPEKLSPGAAKNLALKLVKHEWIFFLAEDSYVLPNYFDLVLPVLSQEKLEVVGGPCIPAKNMSYFSEALAMTLSSPFCTGKTFARHRKIGKLMVPSNEKKLSACNLWMRSTLFHELKFPEDFLQNDDISVLLDLEGHGTKMFYHPSLMVGQFQSSKIMTLLSTTFLSGFYRSHLIKEKLSSLELHFWLPSIFVLSHFLFILFPSWFLFFGRLYFSVIVMMALSLASRRRNISLFPMISFLHYLIVVTYGLGFLTFRLGYRGKNLVKSET
jgi:glycosyltransferase involved in cell wall biosynthesis